MLLNTTSLDAENQENSEGSSRHGEPRVFFWQRRPSVQKNHRDRNALRRRNAIFFGYFLLACQAVALREG
jgi:hypothetical protein